MPPFELLYGRRCRTLICWEKVAHGPESPYEQIQSMCDTWSSGKVVKWISLGKGRERYVTPRGGKCWFTEVKVVVRMDDLEYEG